MQQEKNNKILLMILAALFAALMAVFAQFQIPTPFFPITLQTFAIALCGYTLSVKYSVFSVLAYILLGVAGAPVFHGFCGGIHHITGPAGGFVIGFPFLALLCSFFIKFNRNFEKILGGIIGVLIMFIFGIVHYMLFTDVKSLGAVLIMFGGVFVKDVLLTVLAFYVSVIIKKRVIKV